MGIKYRWIERKANEMKLSRKETMAWRLAGAGCLVVVLGLFTGAAYPVPGMALSFAGAGLLVAGLMWAGLAAHCPRCGRGLAFMHRHGSCPYCGGKLEDKD